MLLSSLCPPTQIYSFFSLTSQANFPLFCLALHYFFYFPHSSFTHPRLSFFSPWLNFNKTLPACHLTRSIPPCLLLPYSFIIFLSTFPSLLAPYVGFQAFVVHNPSYNSLGESEIAWSDCKALTDAEGSQTPVQPLSQSGISSLARRITDHPPTTDLRSYSSTHVCRYAAIYFNSQSLGTDSRRTPSSHSLSQSLSQAGT